MGIERNNFSSDFDIKFSKWNNNREKAADMTVMTSRLDPSHSLSPKQFVEMATLGANPTDFYFSLVLFLPWFQFSKIKK